MRPPAARRRRRARLLARLHVLSRVRSASQGPLPELRRRAGPAFRSGVTVVTSFILMKVERPRLRSIADDLLAIEGIAEVYSVAGPYDLIAVARVKEHEQLNDLVTEQVAALDGILNTETLIAFRSFSKKDLGLLWDIGS
jgi:DNA-binding Lrp family transcriptional regulator